MLYARTSGSLGVRGRQRRRDSPSYLRIQTTGHPLGDKAREHRAVLFEKIGPGEHPCNWCGKTLRWKPGEELQPDSLLADHIDGDKRNNSPENLVPSCNPCNVRRVFDFPADAKFIQLPNGDRMLAVERKCSFCSADILCRKDRADGLRYCNKACSGKHAARLRPENFEKRNDWRKAS